MDNFNKLKKLFFRLGLIGTMIIVTSFSFTNSPIYPASALFMPSSNTALFLPLFEPIVSNHLAISPLDIVWEMIGKVNIDRAQQDLKQLTGEIPLCINAGCYTVTNRLTGSEGLSWAKAYVYSEISKLNFSVTIQDWTRGGYTDQNIIAQKPGVVYPNEKIYFVAHLDGVKSGSSNFPAADDNGSGVVDILELARVLSNYPLMRTVVLLISTGEEEGTLGVQSYLSQLSPGELSAIKKVVNIDMVGYDGNQDKVMELWHGGHSPSIDLTHQMSETIHAYILNLLPGYVVGCGWGDEVPFREKGLPTGLQIENYESERNPYYHTSQDRITKMNLNYWLDQMKATTAIAAHLAIPAVVVYDRKTFLPMIR